jgi:hypothetical protein
MFTPRRSPGPGGKQSGPGSCPESSMVPATRPGAAIVETREEKRCGVFGIGLKIDVLSPHEVLKIMDLRDANGNPAPRGAVNVSDVLLAVDGQSVEDCDASVLESTILGPADSAVCLKLRSATTGGVREFVARRHVPIRLWDEVHVKRSVRADLVGQNLLAEASIVECLAGIRAAILNPSGDFVDLMWDPSRADFHQCSLGLIFALELSESDTDLKPCQVFTVVPGSPASLVGAVLPGDEVVAVDGVAADESNLVKLIEGNNVIGSSCTLSIVRQRAVSEKGPLSGGRITGRLSTSPGKAAPARSARVHVSIVAASDMMPKVHSQPFVQVSLISASDRETVSRLDHLTQADAGTQRYSWKRSESGRHVIKHAVGNDYCSRLLPQIRSRTLEQTDDPIWNENFELNSAYGHADIIAHQQGRGSLEDCPASDLLGQEICALVTLHGRVLKTPSKNSSEEEDGWYGKLIVPSIRAGSTIDAEFPLLHSNGEPVLGPNGKTTCIKLKLSYEITQDGTVTTTPASSSHSARHFDVTLSRCSQSRVDRFQEIVSWFTLLEREFEGSSRHVSVRQSLESLQALVVSLEEERCDDELSLANRLYDFESRIIQGVFNAESALHGLNDDADSKLAVVERQMIDALTQKESVLRELEAERAEGQRSRTEAGNLADSAQVLSKSNGELVRQVCIVQHI